MRLLHLLCGSTHDAMAVQSSFVQTLLRWTPGRATTAQIALRVKELHVGAPPDCYLYMTQRPQASPP